MANQPYNILYFDLETAPDYSRTHLFTPKLPKETLAQMLEADLDYKNPARDEKVKEIEAAATSRVLSTQAEYCQIVGLNFATDEGEPHSAWAGDVDQQGDPINERVLLEAFWTLAEKSKHIIGFNILRFDLPTILMRSALLKIEPWPGLKYYDAKPWENQIIDLLRKRFSNASHAEFKSLKELRRCLELPIPAEYQEVATMAGDSVEELYLQFVAGDESALAKLKLYGKLDIITTRELARLWSGYFMPHLVAR